MRFSLSPVKKPSVRPSGDQNGKVAPSVPATECAEEESRERTQIVVVPSIEAGNATDLPSGDIAVQLPSSAFSGGTIENTERSAVGAAPRTRDNANPAASPRIKSARPPRMRSPGRRRVSATTARGGNVAAALVSDAQRSSLAMSAA